MKTLVAVLLAVSAAAVAVDAARAAAGAAPPTQLGDRRAYAAAGPAPGYGYGPGAGPMMMGGGAGAGPGFGPGGMMGPGMMGGGGGMMGPGYMGPGAGTDLRDAMGVWMQLLQNHAWVKRTVSDAAGGVDTVTSSADPQVGKLLQDHVAQMRALLDACGKKGGCAAPPLRGWDPLFAAVFKNAQNLRLQVTNTSANGAPTGVSVEERGATAYAAALARAHAAVVSKFAAGGMTEAMVAHAAPEPLP